MDDWNGIEADAAAYDDWRASAPYADYGADETGPKKIAATPYEWPDPASIPMRRWLFGYWLLRGEVTAIVAPGGIGKSTFTIGMSVSLASGIPFLNKPLHEGACKVWQWNLEDDRDELSRQITGCSIAHDVGAAECGDRLFVDSGLDTRLCTAIEDGNGFKIVEPVYDELKAEIERRGIDVLIVDPFVSSHEVPENDNSKIDKVGKRWKRLASETKTSIVLVHHTKKLAGREVRAEDSRGAVALINVARSTLVLNPMTADEAERFGITDKAEQRRMVRVDDDKPNRAPPESAWWFRKASIDLGNGEGMKAGDSVGAAMPWSPPDPFDGLSTRDLFNVQLAIDGGEYGADVQAKDWAGHVIAATLGLDVEDATHKSRIKSLIKTWRSNRALLVEKRTASNGKERPFLVVGEWVDPTTLSTLQGGVE